MLMLIHANECKTFHKCVASNFPSSIYHFLNSIFCHLMSLIFKSCHLMSRWWHHMTLAKQLGHNIDPTLNKCCISWSVIICPFFEIRCQVMSSHNILYQIFGTLDIIWTLLTTGLNCYFYLLTNSHKWFREI